MSSRFLSSEQQHSYGRYVGEPSSTQLAHYFHLDDTTKQFVQKRRGDYNRLGFAIQLCTVRFLGTFLTNPIDVPQGVISYLASQLEIAVDCLPNYLSRPTTHWVHAQAIKQHYGYCDFSEQPGHWRLVRWLYQRAWSGGESPSVLFDLTTARLIEQKILLPGVTVLSRLVSSVRERVAHRTWKILANLPTSEQIDKLEALILVGHQARTSPLEQLRKSPTRSSAPTLVNALERLVTIRSLGVGRLAVGKIPPIRFKTLSKTAFTLRAQAIAKVEELARPPEDNYYQKLLQQWRAVRRFLPRLLSTVEFEGNLAGQKILEAWQFLQSIEGSRKPKMDTAPLQIVNKSWSSWVVNKDGSIDRRAYTFCVLEQLLDGLRRRDVFVARGDRWSNPRAKLLQGQDWESTRASVCRTLNLNTKPEPELLTLKQQLDQAYSRTAANLPNNSEVRIEVDKQGKGTLTISNLDKLEEPNSYLQLKDKLEALLPQVDLPEVLLEINAKTGFMDEFTHLNESFARVSDLSISICAVLIAQGCKIGLSPLVRKEIPALTRGRLAWVEQNYFRPETVIQANARLVDAQTAPW